MSKTVKSLRVVVEDWSRSRLVENRGDSVAMEVARFSCSHCPTCSNRMDMVSSRVHRHGLAVRWENVRGGRFIVLSLPKGTNPVRHLAKVLELNIREH
ncbi:MAG: hypothetical protein NTY66_01300 [Candidatus Vogelbacteria bacterium]|nr:hypothetical protein [Candidatus Vogelbacteria bacterium]